MSWRARAHVLASHHTWTPKTTAVADWLTAMVTDDPSWQSTASIFQ